MSKQKLQYATLKILKFLGCNLIAELMKFDLDKVEINNNHP